MWKTSTAAFAVLWLLTLVLYFRRGGAKANLADPNGLVTPAEKELLKHFQQACQKGDASTARKDLACWVRNYAPQELRGSMRDFGAACGDTALHAAIAELDISGFSDDGSGSWKGDSLWLAFKAWQASVEKPQMARIGKKPDLYAR